MKIVYSEHSLCQLQEIKAYIRRSDSPAKAAKFIADIRKQMKNLAFMPYKYRKSVYYDSDDVRGMIFKGYTIVYCIQEEMITIVEVFRQGNDV